MKFSLKATPKWLLVPPVAALLLVLGPLSMTSGAAERQKVLPTAQKPDIGQESGATPATAGRDTKGRVSLPPTGPDFAQVLSTLALVLMVGIGGVFALRRLRQGAPAARGGSSVVSVRQTLRLSARQAVHALEFDDRILLVGTSEKGVVLLDQGKLPERVADELEVLSRSQALPVQAAGAETEDDGAVPKNLVIPRPERPAVRLPKAPQNPLAPAAATATAPGLGDFRTLLQKAGRA